MVAWMGLWLVCALYGNEPHVIKVQDFGLVTTGPNLFALEFFAGWCSVCQAFAPVWKQVAKDSCAAKPWLSIGVVDCVADFLICQAMGIDSYPTIRVFGGSLLDTGVPLPECEHGCPEPSLVIADILRVAVKAGGNWPPDIFHLQNLNWAIDSAQRLAVTSAKCARESKNVVTQGTTDAVGYIAPPQAYTRPIPRQDLMSAIIFGFEREVIRLPLGIRGSERREALEAWLNALASLLPGRANRESMQALLERSRRVEDIDAEKWEDLLRVDASHLLPDGQATGGISWAACRGATADERGYPCGMWLLFHTLISRATNEQAFQTLHAITGYVKHFFGCNSCRSHFLEMVASSKDPLPHEGLLLEKDRKREPPTVDSMLWLWRAHNTVNYRLNQTQGAAQLPKLQWPSQQLCAECYTSNGYWRRAGVAAFLSSTYCEPEPDYTCPFKLKTESASSLTELGGYLWHWLLLAALVCVGVLARAARERFTMYIPLRRRKTGSLYVEGRQDKKWWKAKPLEEEIYADEGQGMRQL